MPLDIVEIFNSMLRDSKLTVSADLAETGGWVPIHPPIQVA